ncbi:MAG TPA: J domain-containing protein [Polyangia bacterium]
MTAARRLYELAQARATGTIRIARKDGTTAPLHLELDAGWVHAVELSPAYSLVGQAPARGEDRLRLLLNLLDGPAGYDGWEWLAAAPPRKRAPCTPFHPAATVRNHLEGLGLDTAALAERIGTGQVHLSAPPHPSCLGQDERPLAAYLQRPHTLVELDGARLLSRERILRLLAFADAVGALMVHHTDRSPYRVLELGEGAPLDEIKRAFRRLARELHPDLHPGASPEERRALEERFAELSAAYRRLV